MVKKKKTTIYLTAMSDEWLIKESERRGISKNDVLQELITEKIDAKISMEKS
jgi:Ribbon-helix-helix protein, copG family.